MIGTFYGRLCLALLGFCFTIGLSGRLQAQQIEHLIVSGGPALLSWEGYRFAADQHDRWHFNFIRPARVRIEQLRKLYGKDADITWLVYRPAYERRQREDRKPHIENIESVKTKYGVRLVWFSTGDEVIRYINQGQNRRDVKIGTFDFFGHSNKYCFMFDYSNQILGCSKAFLHQKDLGKLNKSAFLKNGHAKAWGCHTAESMSGEWRKATGVKLWGAMGKTDYSKLSENGGMPALSPSGFWRY